MLAKLNPNELTRNLQRGEAPTITVVTLLTILVGFQSLVGRPGFFGPLASQSGLPFAILNLGVAVASLWLGFHANGGSRGRDFLLRYVSLSAVLGFWFFVVSYFAYVALCWALYFLVGALTPELYRPMGLAQLLYSALCSLLYLLALQHFFEKLRKSPA